MTYCNLTSIGVLKGEHGDWKDLWEKTQVGKKCSQNVKFAVKTPLLLRFYVFNFKFWSYKVPHLKDIGFDSNMTYETFKITPPDNCQYYAGHTEALVPILYKPKA